MAFDPEIHIIDPATGFMIDKNTGHKVGLENAPPAKGISSDWPKWVELHASQIARDMETGRAWSKLWPVTHQDRVTNKVSVLVENQEQEKAASADVSVPASEPLEHEGEPTGIDPLKEDGING